MGKLLVDERLDSLVQRAGQSIVSNMAKGPRRRSPVQVFIASEVYKWGGHTRVMEDILRTPEVSSPLRSILILTDMFGNYHKHEHYRREACELFPDMEIISLSTPSSIGRIKELFCILNLLVPERVWMFAHHQDIVAYAAAQQCIGTDFYFVHHADHNLTLGATVPHFKHIDISAGCGRGPCLPLTVKDQGQRVFKPSHPLTTATSGTWNKFAAECAYPYASVCGRLGKHVHIGPMPQEFRFPSVVHVEHVQSLWQAMSDYQVDLYLSSWPRGGGRATVEVLGSGTPMAFWSGGNPATSGRLDYNGGLSWAMPHDLLSLLETSSKELERLGQESRDWYEQHHSPACFKERLASVLSE